jgi:hypothetical protein
MAGLRQVLVQDEEEILALKRRINTLCVRTGLEDVGVLYLMRKSAASVPVELFSQDLAPLESLVSYLHIQLGWKLCEVAESLGRDQRVIGATYANVRRKNPSIRFAAGSGIRVPLAIFRRQGLSILESLVRYLSQDRLMPVSEIAKLLRKNVSTIWTALRRARAKKVMSG